MTKYAISAATGHFGQLVSRQLLKTISPADLIAIVRNPTKAQEVLPAGIEIRQADYTDKAALTNALKGVDRLLFISSIPGQTVPRQTQHQNVVEAAKTAGVNYVAYTSFAKADTAKSALSADHVFTEKLLRESGLKHSFLRNAWYLENESAYFKAAQAGQRMVYAAGDGRISFALESEYAEAAAKVLLTAEPKEVYELGGEPTSFADLAQALSTVLKKPVDFQNVSDDDFYQAQLAAGLDEGTAHVLLGMQQMMRDGELDVPTTDLANVLGRQPLSITAALQTILA